MRDNWSWSHERKSAREISSFNFQGDIFLSGDQIDSSIDIPDAWRDLLSNRSEQALIGIWAHLLDRLPSVNKFFTESLCQPVLLIEESGAPSILYPFTSAGEIYFYLGQLPLGKSVSPDANPLWHALPDDLQSFYRNVHNGWTFLSANSMGPSPIGDFGLLSEFDLEPEAEQEMRVPPEQVLRVFHNGAGDYLCLDLGKSKGDGTDAGILWRHENPGELERVDFWAVMDAWIGIFLEEADYRA